ncbi:MAG: hypothetical protein CL565_06760 [Alphaproteobacteria bacterium]|nr:hypothetical protein [Alphaproteobacteria bacterium]|tara:strand:+ start:139 stop:1716 length:1578 start_codon:yes stop_codon:yes gene_type:complete
MDFLKSTLVSTALGGALMAAAPLNAYDVASEDTDVVTMAGDVQDRRNFRIIRRTFEEIIQTVEERSIAQPDMSKLGTEALQYIAQEMNMFVPVTENMSLEDIKETFASLPEIAAITGKTQLELRNVSIRAMDLMVNKIDRHSDYISKEEYEIFREKRSSKYVGVGITYRKQDNEDLQSPNSGLIEILSTIESGPGHNAGLNPRDFITHIDGKSVQDMGSEDISRAIGGEKGTNVVFTIIRGTDTSPFDVTVTRNEITRHWLSSRVLENNIGYIKIDSFQQGVADDLKSSIKKMYDVNQNMAGFVIDLRGNGGGLVSEAVEIVDAFLDEGEIALRQGRTGGTSGRIVAERGDIARGAPIVIITDGYSASASELTAGALQDNGRAKIVGVRSFGKGVIQRYYKLPDGGQLKLTSDYYISPSGDAIQWSGVTPDVRVEGVERPNYTREYQRAGSVRPLNTGLQDEFRTNAICTPVESITYDFNTAGEYIIKDKMDFDLACAYEALGYDSPYTRTVPVNPSDITFQPAG